MSSKYKQAGESKLRGRWHDLNSQRRYRGKSTVGWETYKKQTANGRKQYKSK